MANVDRPNGFRPVKTKSGAPLSAMIRTCGVADGTDIFVGDALKLSSGLATPVTAHNDITIGVAVGFGKKASFSNSLGSACNPTNLSVRYYEDTGNTHTDWVVYYIPTEDVIFEAQFDGTPTSPVVGAGYGLIYTAGSSDTGQSAQEIDGDDVTDKDVLIVEIPDILNNDITAAYGRVWVMFDAGLGELAAAL